MSTTLSSANSPGDFRPFTLVELANRFGDIPATRICLSPAPGQATEQDALDLHEREHRLFELVDGTLIEKSMGNFESLVAGQIHGALFVYLKSKPIGYPVPADLQIKPRGANIRIPDVAFISKALARRTGFPKVKIATLSPTIAVEVISESNSEKEMAEKLQEYFAGGSEEVWYVYPEQKELHQ
jgi:Uma2 family endonuclease